MMAQEIHITLPSNASMKLYPENKPQLYKTELLRPLTLKGSWEVAIIDIQYPYKWKTIEQPTKIECRIQENAETVPDRGEVTFPAGYYADIPAVLNKFERISNQYFKDKRASIGIVAEFDKVSGRVFISKLGEVRVNFFYPKGRVGNNFGSAASERKAVG